MPSAESLAVGNDTLNRVLNAHDEDSKGDKNSPTSDAKVFQRETMQRVGYRDLSNMYLMI